MSNQQSKETSPTSATEKVDQAKEIRVRFQFKAQIYAPNGPKTHRVVLKRITISNDASHKIDR